MQPQTTKLSPRLKGCLVYGGITVLVLLGIIAIAAFVTYRKYRTLRDDFTDTELKAVAVEDTNASQARRLSRTYDSMQRAAQQGTSGQFEFTALQLNQLVAAVPAVKDARGKAHFSIVDDKLKVEAGIPLGQFPGFKERFVNGEFTLDIRLENGVLDIFLVDAIVRGQPLPPVIMDRLKQMNIAQQAMQNQEFRRQLQGIKTLRILDGKLLVETGK